MSTVIGVTVSNFRRILTVAITAIAAAAPFLRRPTFARRLISSHVLTHPAVRVEHLTARDGDAALEDASSAPRRDRSMPSCSGNALLLLRCPAGRHKTTEGQISILGGGASDR
jgi:hypothetical protein